MGDDVSGCLAGMERWHTCRVGYRYDRWQRNCFGGINVLLRFVFVNVLLECGVWRYWGE